LATGGFLAGYSRGKSGGDETDKAGMPNGKGIKVFLLLFVHKKKILQLLSYS
jgi:hypothetical protein